jgi:hypothetical protein
MRSRNSTSERNKLMKNSASAKNPAGHRNLVAAELSLIPGAGQFYKGHYAEGSGVMLLGIAVAIWTTTLFSLTYAAGALFALFGGPVDWFELLLNPLTLYVGLIPALLFWAWVVTDAYVERDLRHHDDQSTRTKVPTQEPCAADRARRLPEPYHTL